MKHRIRSSSLAALSQLVTIAAVQASSITVGVNGINSSGLSLTGSGIGVGMVEPFRPGLPGFDMPANSNPDVVPQAVLVGTEPPEDPDMNIDEHAEEVAGVIISSDTTDSDPVPDGDFPVGVARNARLFAAAIEVTTPFPFETEFAEAAQAVATSNGATCERSISVLVSL